MESLEGLGREAEGGYSDGFDRAKRDTYFGIRALSRSSRHELGFDAVTTFADAIQSARSAHLDVPFRSRSRLLDGHRDPRGGRPRLRRSPM